MGRTYKQRSPKQGRARLSIPSGNNGDRPVIANLQWFLKMVRRTLERGGSSEKAEKAKRRPRGGGPTSLETEGCR